MQFLDTLTLYSDWGLLTLRLAVGAVFFVHGKSKWAMWKPGAQGNMKGMMKLLSVVEPLSALALITGVWMPVGAAALSLVMLGALYFKIKVWKMPFTTQSATGWEFDLVLLAANLALLTTGPGAIVLSL